ncbi:hypothetical protein AC579_9497 [Pseudocercospora musae]|uniref:Uncharacterized protein n=1 Tax=Pseudocercospora musae TaxID=113226 RepID=A0A139IN46_9PEZI|nr:hypothetical protein AC579_9497 [Pseudocercospora musae]
MDVDMLSPQTKENNSPVFYPELPSPPSNTFTHANASSPTWHSPSNVSRKRAPRLPGLADTPARPSFSQQMLKHWSTSTPKLPQEHLVSVQGDSSSPKDTCISSPNSEEDPLNDLERAVAMEFPNSPNSKQRRKTLFIPGPHCRQYDSDDTSEAWTGDEIFLGKREGPKVSRVAVSPGRCKRTGLGSPLRNCVARTPEEKPRRDAQLLSKDSDDSMGVDTEAEPDQMDEDTFVTARQDIRGDSDDCEDSGNCSSAQDPGAESPPKVSKGSRFFGMRPGPLYSKLPESTNSTDLDLSPAPAGTSKHMQVSQENLQKWNKAQLSRPRTSRF